MENNTQTLAALQLENAHPELFSIPRPAVIEKTSDQFTVTTWSATVQRSARGGVRQRPTLQAFGEQLRLQHTLTFEKGEGPAWNATTNTDGHRCNQSTVEVHGIVLDCDGAGDWDALLQEASAMGLDYVAHRSSGHTDALPKWRFFVPFSEPYPCADDGAKRVYRALYEQVRVKFGALAGLKNQGFDPACSSVSHQFYLGHRRPGMAEGTPDREVVVNQGTQRLDWRAEVTGIKTNPLGANFLARAQKEANGKWAGAGVAKLEQRTLPADTEIRMADGGPNLPIGGPNLPPEGHCYCPGHGGSGKGSAFVTHTSALTPTARVHCKVCGITWRSESAPMGDGVYEVAAPRIDPVTPQTWFKTPGGMAVLKMNSRYIDDPGNHTSARMMHNVEKLMLQGGTFAFRSSQGTGKTTAVDKLLRRCERHLAPAGWTNQIAVANRVTLTRDLARRLGFASYQDDTKALKVATTLDSMRKIPTWTGDDMEPVVLSALFWDEVTQGIRHLTGGTIGYNAPEAITNLREWLNRTRVLILADADLTEGTIETLRKIAPDAPCLAPGRVLFVDNEYAPEGKSAVFYENKADVTLDMLAEAKLGKRLFIATSGGPDYADSLKTVLVGKAGVKAENIRVYSRETSGDAAHAAELADATVGFSKYQIVIATPTCGTGVDCQDKGFDRIYGVFPSHDVGANDCVQALHRVRTPKDPEYRVWVDARKQKRETDPAAIRACQLDIRRRTEKDALTVYGDATGPDAQGPSGEAVPLVKYGPGLTLEPLDGLHMDLWCGSKAYMHAQTNDLRASVAHRLMQGGFVVRTKGTVAGGEFDRKEVRKATREASAQNLTDRAERVAKADVIDIATAEEIKGKPITTQAERDAMELAFVSEFYGDAAPSPELILKDRKGAARGPISLLAGVALYMAGATDPDKKAAACLGDLKSANRGLTAYMKAETAKFKVLMVALKLYGVEVDAHNGTWAPNARIVKPGIKVATHRAFLLAVKKYLGITHRPIVRVDKLGEKFVAAEVDEIGLLGDILGKFGLRTARVGANRNASYVLDGGHNDEMFRLSTAAQGRRVRAYMELVGNDPDAEATVARNTVALEALERAIDEAIFSSQTVGALGKSEDTPPQLFSRN